MLLFPGAEWPWLIFTKCLLQKRALAWYRFSIMQIMNVIFFSTVILSLNIVYFKSIALFMHDVTINLVPPNKSSLLEPKSATIDFIAFFMFLFFPSRSLHFSKLTQNILKIAITHQSSLI